MHRRTFLIGGVAAAGLARARLAAAETRGRFTPLFDGGSLKGWHRAEFPATSTYGGGRWTARDGAIQGERFPAGDQRGSVLLSDATFGDFELELELWPDWGCDSGVFIRCTERGECIQIKVDYLDGGDVGFIHGQGTGGYVTQPVKLKAKPSGDDFEVVDVYDAVKTDGLLYAANAAQWRAAWKPKAWNRLRVRCAGKYPRITTWINDAKTCDMDSTTFHARHRLAVEELKWDAPPAFDKDKLYAQIGDRGHIGLQIHPGNRWAKDGVVRYRRIQLQEL